MIDNFGNCIAFLIDTDSYAGNFERQMRAHITGHVGECEVGEEFVDDEISNKFLNVMDIPDEHGCLRPVSSYHSSGQYNSVAIFFDSLPTVDQIELMKERAMTFLAAFNAKGRMRKNKKEVVINILGFRQLIFETIIKETNI